MDYAMFLLIWGLIFQILRPAKVKMILCPDMENYGIQGFPFFFKSLHIYIAGSTNNNTQII